MTEAEQKAAAKKFAAEWKQKGDEKSDTQKFWLSLLRDVYGVEEPEKFLEFEVRVKNEHTNFIDCYLPATQVMIEQKTLGKNLRKAVRQSDGSMLTPVQQAKRYIPNLPRSMHPRWLITCNFSEFLVYDMEKPNSEPEQILLKDLPKEYYRLQFLVDTGSEHIRKEMEISLKAGELVGKLYDEILKQYKDPTAPETLKSLNMLCVRLVFCLYAEDAGIFGSHGMFHDYLKQFSINEIRGKLIELFRVLDTKAEDRDPYMEDALAAFPYVNGGLFADEAIEIPRFTEEMIHLLLEDASAGFDWSEISPTIFGAVFESTLNPETRRSGGMHYTSIENIHKVINPLFLDDLKTELAEIKALKVEKTRNTKLEAFRKKLASLKFLDPACGSGNFLTETYLSLRRLENEALMAATKGQMMLGGSGDWKPIAVSIGQFYGIEINDFAVTVAKTALWIAESQMMHKTEEIMQMNLEFLPLKSYANIVEGNALRVDWESVVPKHELHYIMGNPPFVGARLMSKEQKDDVFTIFDGVKNNGNLDYVSCWYKKSADMMTGTTIRTALVSTNSITQGEQVAILWKNLFEHGVHIDFAHRTFKWDSEASLKAHVHCVIVGFSKAPNTKPKRLFDNGIIKIVENINGYLVEADDIVITKRKNPICSVSRMDFGSMPNDGGFLSNFSTDDKNAIIKKYPIAEPLFKRFVGATEFLHNKERWCLWLQDISPKTINSIPPVFEAVQNVRKMRIESSRAGTRKLADTPTLFGEIRQPLCDYLIVPRHSSENRKYIPIGYANSNIICGDANMIVPDGSLFNFGVLTSNVHMAWVRTVCGRIKSDYRYSKDIVYNNFPWCNPTDEQKAKIEKTAQNILNARALYPDCSLADLYDETTMPPELRKAHQLNDLAVMAAYGFDRKMTESECVAALMKMYQALTEQ